MWLLTITDTSDVCYASFLTSLIVWQLFIFVFFTLVFSLNVIVSYMLGSFLSLTFHAMTIWVANNNFIVEENNNNNQDNHVDGDDAAKETVDWDAPD
jgi:hypothetical protein